eukprot:570462-Rhodomonas_salina.1
MPRPTVRMNPRQAGTAERGAQRWVQDCLTPENRATGSTAAAVLVPPATATGTEKVGHTICTRRLWSKAAEMGMQKLRRSICARRAWST